MTIACLLHYVNHMNFMKYIIFFIVTIIAFVSCSSDQKNKEYLPKASGKSGDLLIIMDSVQWRGELGDEVRKVFAAEVPGLPQSEPMFNILWVHPSKGLSMLNQMRNLLYVFTLDQKTQGSVLLRRQFSPETLAKISSDTTFYLSTDQDEFSKGQQVMYLFGDTEQNLTNRLINQRQSLIDYFNRSERRRMYADLFKTKGTKGLTEFLSKEQKVEIHVPVGYRLADKQNDFVWLRSITAQTDKDIVISWKPYESEYQLLPDSVIYWRNDIAKKYLYEDPENIESYLVTEEEDASVQARQVKLNEHFAMELRGLWRTNNRSMGGPFVSYALIDQPRGLLYYIEGFAYAPGKDKREMMRELETILWTFKTSAQIDVNN